MDITNLKKVNTQRSSASSPATSVSSYLICTFETLCAIGLPPLHLIQMNVNLKTGSHNQYGPQVASV